MSPRGGGDRPRIRLIWDELLSHAVARALRELGFNVTWVGSRDPGVPPRGSSDADVIAFALQQNQIIVTSNHNMMTLCDEAALGSIGSIRGGTRTTPRSLPDGWTPFEGI